MITYNEFLDFSPETVRQKVTAQYGNNFGVGIPFNGTRRWYLEHFNKSRADLLERDYAEQATRQMRKIFAMMFADGVTCVYTPILGRDLAERGSEYMNWANGSIPLIVDETALAWYETHQVQASCYGQLDLLSETSQQLIDKLVTTTTSPQKQHFVRYGIFADKPTSLLIDHTLKLHASLGRAPSETELIEAFYGGQQIDVQMWIGSDQPSIFDVPLVIHGATDLYFLQFPTPYLDHQLWRRLLYDILYVRGDEETLYPENITHHRMITGLGKRKYGYWIPSAE